MTSYRGRNARPDWIAWLVSMSLAGLAAGLGAIVSPGLSGSNAAWYAALAKPTWTPPGAWFGVAWTLLYVAMATAAWLIWQERYHRVRRVAMLAYCIQLSLNAIWSPLFFGAKSLGGGLLIIIALWLAILWTLREFAAMSRLAAWLLVPYLGWVAFAAALNAYIWRHNL